MLAQPMSSPMMKTMLGFLAFAFFLGRGRAGNPGHQRQGQYYGQCGQESVVWLFGHTYLLV